MLHRTANLLCLLSLAFAGCVIKPAQPEPQQPPGPAQPGTQPAPAPAPAPPGGGVTVETITDEQGNVYHVDQGIAGSPADIGCSDGQREAFVDVATFPNIAGCLGSWQGLQSMRAPTTGQPCGDDSGSCAVPGDLCAPGWRICGATGLLSDLQQVTAEQCEQAGGGRFSAGLSHCETQSGCHYDQGPNATYECFPSGWCSETVCCGRDCGQFGSCRDGIWPNKTHIAQGVDQGCGATSSRRAGGVLCCRE